MQKSFLKKVIVFVIFFHVVFLLSLPKEKATSLKQQITVKTYLPPPIQINEKISIKTAKKAYATKKPKQKKVSRKKSAPKKLKIDKLKKILDQNDSIAPPLHSSKDLTIPKLPELKIDLGETNTSNANQYIHLLVHQLKSNLRLPGNGKVTMKICINRSGKIENLTILETKSEQNMLYLKNNLHKMSFPCFNDYMLKDKNIAFTITFYNES